MNIYRMLVILIGVNFINCSGNKNSVEKFYNSQKGLILFFNTDHLYFIPVSHLDQDSCINLFHENMNRGFEFTPSSEDHIDLVKANSKHYRVQNVERGLVGVDTVNIVPVEITYELINDLTQKITDKQPYLVIKIENKIVRFDYNFVDVEVSELKVLRCD